MAQDAVILVPTPGQERNPVKMTPVASWNRRDDLSVAATFSVAGWRQMTQEEQDGWAEVGKLIVEAAKEKISALTGWDT